VLALAFAIPRLSLVFALTSGNVSDEDAVDECYKKLGQQASVTGDLMKSPLRAVSSSLIIAAWHAFEQGVPHSDGKLFKPLH